MPLILRTYLLFFATHTHICILLSLKKKTTPKNLLVFSLLPLNNENKIEANAKKKEKFVWYIVRHIRDSPFY